MNRQWIVGLASMLMAVCGCSSDKSTQTVDMSSGAPRMAETPIDIPAAGNAPISDVPIPKGFELDQEHSRNATAAGARFIDHVYEGSGDKRSVHWFYKRQMPISRWALMRDVFSQGEIQMDFDNQRETCRVVITDGKSIWPWSHPIKITVTVLPMGKIADDTGARK